MKNVFKRLLSLTAVATLLLAIFPVSLPVSAGEYNGLTYYPCGSFHGDYIEIRDTNALVVRGEYTIPDYLPNYNGDPVPVTTLHTGSFQNLSLTGVTIPDTVTSLGWGWTFDGCRKMTYVKNSDNVTLIPRYSFSNCDVLESVHIGNSVTEIEWNAFVECPKLTYIELPMSIQKIGDMAFDSEIVVYYPGTAKQWKKVVKGYGIEERMLYQPTVDSVKTVTKGVKITVSQRNATKYIFYRQTKSGGKWGDWKKIKTTTETTYTDKSAVVGRTYRYAVKAANGDHVTRLSSASEAITYVPSTKAKVAKATKGYKITWSKVSGASKYIVYRRTGTGKWKAMKTTTSRSYTDKTTKTGYKYQYGVKVVRGSAKSTMATTAAVMKLSSTKPKATNTVAGVKISWSKVRGATSYDVYYKMASGQWLFLTNTTARSVVDTTAWSGTTYTYRVKAVNGKFTGGTKGTSTIKPLDAPYTIAMKSGKYMAVNWTTVGAAEKYVIYRRVGSGSWKKIRTQKGPYNCFYTDKSVKKGKTYQYKVVAVNGKYKSSYRTSEKVKM